MAKEGLGMPPMPSAGGQGADGGDCNDSAGTRLLDQLLLGRQSAAEQMGCSHAAHDLGLLARSQRITCRERSADETAKIIKHLDVS